MTHGPPMTDADETNHLQAQLAAHRRTLAVLLRQLASLGADHAPPACTGDLQVALAEARAEIARLKAALHDAGVAVEDQVGDEATPDEEVAELRAAPVIAAPHAERDVNIATHQTIVNVAHHPQPRPPIDPAQAQQQLDRLPLDSIPNPAPLPMR
jgi:hypothetical protein